MQQLKRQFVRGMALCCMSMPFNSHAIDIIATSQNVRGPYISRQVNVDALGQNITGDAANETSIAISPVNPDNIVIAWRHFEHPQIIDHPKAGIAYSQDGGLNWVFPSVIQQELNRTDPVVEVDSLGDFYYQSLRTSGGRVIDVFKSSDGGMSWQDPVSSFGINGDKNWIAIDRTKGVGHGHIYSFWVDSPQDLRHFSRSIDQGMSFEEPVDVDMPNNPVFGTMTVGAEGEVYIAGRSILSGQQRPNEFPKLYFDPFRLVKSTNARDALAPPTFVGQALDLGGSAVEYFFQEKPNRGGQLSQLSVAVDHSQGATRGNVYVLSSVEPTDGIDPEDIHFIRSEDGGDTWSAPVRVNDDLPKADSWQWFSTMSVAENSRIDVVWYDTRNTEGYQISELFYTYSWDAGETWSKNIPVSQPFDTHLGNPLSSNKIGDYIGAVSDNSGVNVAYPATFNGEQDVYFVHLFPDCNNNALSDVDDIQQAISQDADSNHIPDECENIVLAGDLDSDGDIDRDDMRIILASRNQPATGVNAPKDINGDGVISVRDVRKLMLQCTRPRCAAQ